VKETLPIKYEQKYEQGEAGCADPCLSGVTLSPGVSHGFQISIGSGLFSFVLS